MGYRLPWIQSQAVSTDTTPQTSRGRSYAPKHTRGKSGKPKKGFFRRFWWVFVALPVVVVLAVGGGLVYAYSQIELPKTLPPIQSTFMYDRNGSLLASIHGVGGPDDHPVRPDARVAPRRRARRRGSRLLRPPRHRPGRHPPRRVDRPDQARDRAGRLDDHAAARQAGLRRELREAAGRHDGVRRAPAHDQGEGPRGAAGDQARADAVEGPDPGALPQHHLPGARRVRRAGGGADVLGRRRRRSHREAVRHARRPHHVAEPVRPDRPPRGLEGAPRLRARPDGALRVPRSGEGGRRSRRRRSRPTSRPR